jgi:excisionase family DNA binding protein
MTQPLTESAEPKRLLITIDEAARRLCIGRSHIYQQIQLGRLRSIRIGRSRRILETDLEAFVAELLDDPNRVAYRPELPQAKAAVKRLPLLRGRR